jgi:RNA polymerase-binding transcription factor DksA
MKAQLKKINSYGLCEKCNRLVKPYYIIKGKGFASVRCLKHLPEKEKKLAEIHDRIKNLEERIDFEKILEEIKKEIQSIKSDLKKIGG